MSYHTLQKLVVRMLFDEAFVEQVYREPDQLLSKLDLSDQERQQLLGVDKRAWRYDPLRKKRTLRALFEEFKVSTTIALAETRSLASLDLFFSSQAFHSAVQERSSMGLAFAKFLTEKYSSGELKTPQLPDVIRFEATLAKCRRSLATSAPKESELPKTISEFARVQLAAGVAVGSFQSNLIKVVQAVEQYLFEVSLMPAMVLCEDAAKLDNLPAVDTKKKAYLLFLPGGSGITLVNIEKSDYLLLFEAKRPLTIKELILKATVAGVKKAKAEAIVSEALQQVYLTVT
ncbi:MAG: hypothetical protein JNN15_03590 [Blastocatellia bacterium]|nr:hypothetical protein [Blastocatellia bacterium]